MAKLTFKELMDRLPKDDGPVVRVGVLSTAGTTPEGLPLTELAAIHEFGTSESAPIKIPQRSFIRSTFHRVEKERVALVKKLLKQIMNKQITTEKALNILGQWVAGQIKQTITRRLTEGPDPQANKPATIAAKGSSTPLLDTAQLKNSISYALGSGEKK